MSIKSKLNKNLSSKEIFKEKKSQYEAALKNNGYYNAKLKFHKEEQDTEKQKQSRNITYFNHLFSRNVNTNTAKHSLIYHRNISLNLTSSI